MFDGLHTGDCTNRPRLLSLQDGRTIPQPPHQQTERHPVASGPLDHDSVVAQSRSRDSVDSASPSLYNIPERFSWRLPT